MLKFFKSNIYLLASILLCLASVIWTIFQDRYQYDPHHWGLMLSNARDLSLGLKPYKDIFIQYGILTTLIQSAAFVSLGKTLSTISLITGIFYSAGLFLIFALARQAFKRNSSAFYVLVLAFLFHPIATMPWANYIAFPFIIMGLILLCYPNQSKPVVLFGSGFILGLAVLCREGLLPAIVGILGFSFILDLIEVNSPNARLRKILYKLIGFILPLSIFFLYLYFSNLYPYWKILSIDLPKVYFSDIFPEMHRYFGLLAFYKQGVDKVFALDIRWVLVFLIITSNALAILLAIPKIRKDGQAKIILILSCSSLLLFSSAVHTYDIFRIATGSIVGLIPLLFLLGQYKKIFTIYLSVPLLFSLVHANSGNIYAPSKIQYLQGKPVSEPEIFYGQNWDPKISDYYKAIEYDLMQIQDMQCGIKYHHNHTMDGFLQVISPFLQLQMAPHYLPPTGMRALRPELDTLTHLETVDKDTILYELIKINQLSEYKPKKNYVIYSLYPVTYTNEDNALLILIPNFCK